jgi:hypothetical protein
MMRASEGRRQHRAVFRLPEQGVAVDTASPGGAPRGFSFAAIGWITGVRYLDRQSRDA